MDEGNLKTRAYVAFGAAAVAIIFALFLIFALLDFSGDEEVVAEEPVAAETAQ